MYSEISKWIDNVLKQEIPTSVVAFCFNIYEDGDSRWSMELVGTGSYNVDDEDWACDEVTNFGTRENNFSWNESGEWNEVLDKMISELKRYLDKGACANLLKSKGEIGVGFVDGDIEMLFSK